MTHISLLSCIYLSLRAKVVENLRTPNLTPYPKTFCPLFIGTSNLNGNYYHDKAP